MIAFKNWPPPCKDCVSSLICNMTYGVQCEENDYKFFVKMKPGWNRFDDIRIAKRRVFFSKQDLKKWWLAVCPECGWKGMSNECAGGKPIADTGDFSDVICPVCFKEGEGKLVCVDEDKQYEAA